MTRIEYMKEYVQIYESYIKMGLSDEEAMILADNKMSQKYTSAISESPKMPEDEVLPKAEVQETTSKEEAEPFNETPSEEDLVKLHKKLQENIKNVDKELSDYLNEDQKKDADKIINKYVAQFVKTDDPKKVIDEFDDEIKKFVTDLGLDSDYKYREITDAEYRILRDLFGLNYWPACKKYL